MDRTPLTPLQSLLVEKLANANSEVDQILKQTPLSLKFQRLGYGQIAKKALGFLDANHKTQWLIMTGLRGVGKTTILAQLYCHPQLKKTTRFFLSLDQAQLIGAEMDDVVKALEHQLGQPLPEASQPVFILLDEVHSLPKWSLAIKILYDRCPRIFIVCTSSSALALWTNPDIGRRAQYVQIEPLSLPEANLISMYSSRGRNAKDVDLEKMQAAGALGGKMRTALFDSISALEVYSSLKALEDGVEDYWRDQPVEQRITDYVAGYETLPYVSGIKDQYRNNKQPDQDMLGEIRARILQSLSKVYSHDLDLLGNISKANRHHFPGILLWLANSNQQSLTKMAQRFRLNVATLQDIMQVLVDSQLLTAVPPLGASTGKISKAYKYLFGAPAIRQALHSFVPNEPHSTEDMEDSLKGSLLEDTVGFYLKQAFSNQAFGGVVEYDASRAGADFIVMPSYHKKQAIALEVGWHKHSSRQAQATLRGIGSERYGLIITDCDLRLDDSEQAVFVPLRYFLLMQPLRHPA